MPPKVDRRRSTEGGTGDQHGVVWSQDPRSRRAPDTRQTLTGATGLLATGLTQDPLLTSAQGPPRQTVPPALGESDSAMAELRRTVPVQPPPPPPAHLFPMDPDEMTELPDYVARSDHSAPLTAGALSTLPTVGAAPLPDETRSHLQGFSADMAPVGADGRVRSRLFAQSTQGLDVLSQGFGHFASTKIDDSIEAHGLMSKEMVARTTGAPVGHGLNASVADDARRAELDASAERHVHLLPLAQAQLYGNGVMTQQHGPQTVWQAGLTPEDLALASDDPDGGGPIVTVPGQVPRAQLNPDAATQADLRARLARVARPQTPRAEDAPPYAGLDSERFNVLKGADAAHPTTDVERTDQIRAAVATGRYAASSLSDYTGATPASAPRKVPRHGDRRANAAPPRLFDALL